jgi:1-deoxy-D-xylulose-5-phosphate reductoisomerase
MGNPDMRTPIAHALAFPDRILSGVPPIDLAKIGQLQFERPDFDRFPCLKLAYDALRAGGSAPAILNAANEVAVQAFLDGQIGFRMIDRLIARVMDKLPHDTVRDIDAVLEHDRSARAVAHSLMHT